jgi:hypothetical protein
MKERRLLAWRLLPGVQRHLPSSLKTILTDAGLKRRYRQWRHPAHHPWYGRQRCDIYLRRFNLHHLRKHRGIPRCFAGQSSASRRVDWSAHWDHTPACLLAVRSAHLWSRLKRGSCCYQRKMLRDSITVSSMLFIGLSVTTGFMFVVDSWHLYRAWVRATPCIHRPYQPREPPSVGLMAASGMSALAPLWGHMAAWQLTSWLLSQTRLSSAESLLAGLESSSRLKSSSIHDAACCYYRRTCPAAV